MSEILAEEAAALKVYRSRQRLLSKAGPHLRRAITAACTMLDDRPHLMPAFGGPLDGLIDIKDATPDTMTDWAGNIWTMFDMCRSHRLKGELMDEIRAAHLLHRAWVSDN
jgi:hypothetical protein